MKMLFRILPRRPNRKRYLKLMALFLTLEWVVDSEALEMVLAHAWV